MNSPMMKAIQDTTGQNAKLLNDLPRPSRLLRSVPNEWYFDVRYVPLEPTPHHMLFLIRPGDKFVHTERLPLGVSQDQSGIEYFPETAEEAAPEVANALIYSFVNDFGRTLPPRSSAPWKLSTFDQGLAVEVGKVFRQLGVREELWRVHVARSLDSLAQALCDEFFSALKKSMGVTYFVPPPQTIGFSNYRPPRDDFFITRAKCGTNVERTLAYAQDRMNSRFPAKDILSEDIMQGIQSVMALFQIKSSAVALAEADAGDPESALDIAFRIRFGCGCTPNRCLERFYFTKALSSQASPEAQATAHAALIGWYTASEKDFRNRAMHAACHHANQSARLSMHGKTPPAVLSFMSKVFEHQTKDIPHFSLLYKEALKAVERRNAEVARENSKMEQKRLQHPHRYRCAAVGCEVLADSGRMLSRCSGSCDADKKPSYCGKECQRADWQNHKPFCKPGAACSVIDTTPTGNQGGATKKGAIQVNVENKDGSTTAVSSSTMTAAELKEIREVAQRQFASTAIHSNVHIERFKI